MQNNSPLAEKKNSFGNWRVMNPTLSAAYDQRVSRAISLLEEKELDITAGYRQWESIGLAFSYEYHEVGRDYFHRVSRFYPKYSQEECDRFYDRCLARAKGSYDLFDFLHMVRKAGITREELDPLELQVEEELKALETQQEPEDRYLKNLLDPSTSAADDFELPEVSPEEAEFLKVLKNAMEKKSATTTPNGFPEETYMWLPDFLSRVVEPAKGEHEKSLMLLGALGVLSSALPSFYGIYDTLVRPNLFVFVSAPPASGKGILSFNKYLVMPIQRAKEAAGKSAKEDYEQALIDYSLSKDASKEKPRKPAERMHFIPANNSSTGMFQLINDNEGNGLIFENEADTLVNSLKTDYGDFSEGLRKAFQHEDISYYRRTDRENVRIEKPCISTVISGTPGQLLKLFPAAENGFFSRFLFYNFSEKPQWKKKFDQEDSFDLRSYYEDLGEEFFRFYQRMEHREVQVVFTQDQKDFFNAFFSEELDKYYAILSISFLASVKRMGLSFFRLCMILTALRWMDEPEIPQQLECHPLDFSTAHRMIVSLVKHSNSAFSLLPAEKPPVAKSNLKERLYMELAQQFTRQDVLQLCESEGISTRTADRYIAEFVAKGSISRDLQGVFRKVNSLN